MVLIPRLAAVSVAASVTIAGLNGGFVSQPAQAQAPRPIPAGDCKSMTANTGGKGIWYGEYSGRYEDSWGWVYPLAGRGCFKSEYNCRRWLNQMLSLADGWSAIRSCKPYNKRR